MPECNRGGLADGNLLRHRIDERLAECSLIEFLGRANDLNVQLGQRSNVAGDSDGLVICVNEDDNRWIHREWSHVLMMFVCISALQSQQLLSHCCRDRKRFREASNPGQAYHTATSPHSYLEPR